MDKLAFAFKWMPPFLVIPALFVVWLVSAVFVPEALKRRSVMKDERRSEP